MTPEELVKRHAAMVYATCRRIVRDAVEAEDVAQAFGFGFRGEAARESGAPGLGVGLWTCRRLAERNGGAVELRSTQGQGTVVTVTLPAPAG